jgi:hypothetical protein
MQPYILLSKYSTIKIAFSFVRGILELSDDGGIKVNDQMLTSQKGKTEKVFSGSCVILILLVCEILY